MTNIDREQLKDAFIAEYDPEPRRAAPADTQEALDAKGLESSTTAFSQEQLAKLAFAIFYSANLCAPQNIEAVVKEIDTCGNDCEHVRGSHCQREERGDYCPFSLAEDLRQISAALFGPRAPSHYVPSVFGPECMTAFRATTRAPGEGEPVDDARILEFGKGELVVDTGTYLGRPCVFICAAKTPGEVGTSAKREGHDKHSLQPHEVVLVFPTMEQADAVDAALIPYAAPPALAAPSYAQPAPRADLVEREWDYRTYRLEWRVQSVEVDQYDQNPRVYAEAAFPTREEALAHREKIAKPHQFVEGRWVPNDAPHSYVDCRVTYVETRVEAIVALSEAPREAEVTGKMTEAACSEWAEKAGFIPFEQMLTDTKDRWRVNMRYTLRAALSAAPKREG